MNENNSDYNNYGKIDLTKEDIEPIEATPVLEKQTSNDYYSEEIPVSAERIDLTKEDIPPVINNNTQQNNEQIEIKDYDAPGGISQVYIPETPKKKLPKKVVGFISIFLIILVLVGVCFLYFMNKPKQLFLSSINDLYKELNENYYSKVVESISNVEGDVISTSNKMSFNLKTMDSMYLQTAEMLNNMNLEITTQNDFKNQIMAYNLGLTADEKNVLNANLYGAPNEIYLELKDLFSKYIKMDIDEETYASMFSGNSVKEIEEVVSKFKNLYLGELQDNDFSKVKEEIEIDGKSYNTKKVTLKLENARIKEIQNNVIEKILADKDIIKSLSKIFNSKEDEIKRVLTEGKNVQISLFEMNMYLSKKELIKMELVVNDAFEKNEFIVIDIDNYFDLTYKNNDYITFSLTNKNNQTFINFENSIIEITKNNENEYAFILKSTFDKIEGTLKTLKKEISNKEQVDTIELSLEITPTTKLTINNQKTTKIIDKITLPDVTNSVDVENLTDEEINTILEKISSNLSNIFNTYENTNLLE